MKTTSFKAVRAVAKRELFSYFNSAVAYVFIVIFLLMAGFFTFYVSNWFEAGQADLRSFFQWHPWIYILLVPAIAMRLWSEEKRLGTIEIVLTLPLKPGQVILGKFLAAWLFIGMALALTFPMVCTVAYLGEPDLGAIACGYLGSFLMAGAFLGIGVATSAMTGNQVISFIIAVVICLFFILAGYPPTINMLAGWTPLWFVKLLEKISFISHFAAVSRGVVDLRDMLYFVSFMFLSLYFNGLLLEWQRQH